MKTTVHWMGGWASDLGCWEPMLRDSFPAFNHRFLDSHAFLDSSPSEAELTALGPGHIAAAWSLGSLLCHRWMEQGIWPRDLSLLSLCPVFDFPRGAFGEPIILSMEAKLAENREAVLRDFWRRMPRAGEIPPIWEQTWLVGTRKYTHEELVRGLEFLRNTLVNSGGLLSLPRQWELLVGEQDRLAPRGLWIKTLPPSATLQSYPGGHLPFWECPDLLRACLKRLESTESA